MFRSLADDRILAVAWTAVKPHRRDEIASPHSIILVGRQRQ
jgi:hypothetical protein